MNAPSEVTVASIANREMVKRHGIRPVEFKVLVRPKAIEEKTAGGIYIPDETKERDQFAVIEGELSAASPLAFTYGDWADTKAIPKIGDRVLFAKYAGTKVKGADGVEYRLVNDKDITAVLT